MKAQEIIKKFEKLIPLDYQESYDRCGLQVGSEGWDVKKVLFAMDACHEVVRAALDQKAQMIVTHHPLQMEDYPNLKLDTYNGKIIEDCIQNKILIYTAHTNHDNSIHSLNRYYAKAMALKKIKPLLPKEDPKIGSGISGELSQTKSLSALLPEIKKLFKADYLRLVGDSKKKIKKVALCTGSGASLLDEVISQKIDLFLTGDLKYHYATEALRADVALVDLNHFVSERESVVLLLKLFKKLFGTSLKYEHYNDLKDPFQLIC